MGPPDKVRVLEYPISLTVAEAQPTGFNTHTAGYIYIYHVTTTSYHTCT